MEIIGVLGIMGVLAIALIVSILKRTAVADFKAETQSMTTMASAYKTLISRERAIPNMTNWWTEIGEELSMSETKVLDNRHGIHRLMVPHPDAIIGNPLLGQCNLTTGPRYVQNVFGVTNRGDLRVIFLSSLGGPLSTTPTSTAFNSSVDDFLALWNTPVDTLPNTAAFGSLNVKGEELLLLRMDLTPLFCRVVLNNMDTVNPWYSLDGSTDTNKMARPIPAGFPPVNQVKAFFLKGTTLNLRSASTDANPGVIQMSVFLSDDVAYSFDNGRWVDTPTQTKDTRSTFVGFNDLIRQYLDVQRTNITFVNSHVTNASFPQDIVNDLYTYMIGYSDWAESGFWGKDANGGALTNATPPEAVVIQAGRRLNVMLIDTTAK